MPLVGGRQEPPPARPAIAGGSSAMADAKLSQEDSRDTVKGDNSMQQKHIVLLS